MRAKLFPLVVLVLSFAWAIPAASADNSIHEPSPGDTQSADQPTPDPLAPFNEKMFWFNRELDTHVTRPIATGYAKVIPEEPRRCVDRFFKNVGVIPRFANSLF
ncbi:MAG TPA: MlaA family lipoprotein, partial [Candidatus Binataceae bacterium]|nr:MlaA family lipoprotein [Candidatus Binataceae bacterium]